MKRIGLSLAIIVISVCCGCGGGNSQQAGLLGVVGQALPPLLQEGVFQASLPVEGSFNSTRTPAVSNLAVPGASYWDNSANVSQNGQAADFALPGGTMEYGIWRFAGTPQDSLGSIDVNLGTGAASADYWVGIADYTAGHWVWLGQVEGGMAHIEVNGADGQHSSPAGHIYVAVLAESGSPFSVDNVSIEYLQRYDVSGVVLDMQDQPLAGALVTTNLDDPEQVFTNPDGSFTLHGIPSGNWALMATLDGYAFYPDAEIIAVADANLTGVELRGNPQLSGFVGSDADEPNNEFANITLVSGDALDATISVLDDPEDYYAFAVPSEGFYYFQFEGDGTILGPTLELYVDDNVSVGTSSYYVIRGTTWIGYYCQRAGRYGVRVQCEGGGGAYHLSMQSGETREFSAYLGDSGDPGDGDDGLREELYNTRVLLEFADFTCTLMSAGTGSVAHDYVPPLPATVRPVDKYYTFTPETVAADFAAGDLISFDFNVEAAAPTDALEPNNDFASATELTLPLAEPVAGWIGGFDLTGDDHLEYFSFTVPEGQYVMVRARFPEHTPGDFMSGGELNLYDDTENNVSTDDYNAFDFHLRSRDPLPAGKYYAELYMEGNVMPYELEVAAYEGHYLSAYYELDGQPLRDCNFTVQLADQGYTLDDSSNSDGIAQFEMPLMDGERVYVHHERFGTMFNPDYEWVEINGSDVQLTPQITLSDDELEPNDNWTTPVIVTLPFSTQATVDLNSDSNDSYQFTIATPGTIQIKVSPQDPDVILRSTIRKQPTSSYLLQHDSHGDDAFFFRADDAGDYVLEFRSYNTGATAYKLDISEDSTPVYLIGGTLDTGVGGEGPSGTYLVNHTTGDVLPYTNTNYTLGYYPDGTYQIEWMLSNYDVTPSGPASVVINGADETVDFTATYTDYDAYEPNNYSSDAATITAPFSFSATTDYRDPNRTPDYDTYDYYKFVASADGLFEVIMQPQTGYPGSYRVTLTEDNWYTEVGFGKLSPSGSRRMLRWNLTSGKTYYVIVRGYQDMTYSISGDYVPKRSPVNASAP